LAACDRLGYARDVTGNARPATVILTDDGDMLSESGRTPPFRVLLKRFRLAVGLTHEALAERASLSARAISDLERGVSRAPRQRSLALLSKALELNSEQRDMLETAAHFPAVVPERAELPFPLPVQLTSFIGRTREMTAVLALLRQQSIRLVTLTGPGGIGKTRLALRIAEDLRPEFPDGIFFVALAPLADPDDIGAAVAQALGMTPTSVASLATQISEFIHDRTALLVLDNHEHLLGGASLLSHLLLSCPGLKALVTSRAPLRLSAEQQFAVRPMRVPDLEHLPSLERLARYPAVALFVERASRVEPFFELTRANAATIAAICARVDGLPLGIELAAARVKLLPPHALLALLDGLGSLHVLTGGARDVSARQQTLRATIEWSYELLTHHEQRLFRQLAIFVGGCTLDAAMAVVATRLESDEVGTSQLTGILPFSGGCVDAELLGGLASLVDKNLLRQEEDPSGMPRYMMLDTIRAFALDQLARTDEARAIRERHARHFLAMVEAAGAVLLPATGEVGPSDQMGTIRGRLTQAAEQGNIRAALRWLVEFG